MVTKKYTYTINEVSDSDKAKERVDQVVKDRELEDYDYDYNEDTRELKITWTKEVKDE